MVGEDFRSSAFINYYRLAQVRIQLKEKGQLLELEVMTN
jgi:hypothetical protein